MNPHETIKAELAELVKAREQAVANVHALSGAISFGEQLLKKFPASEPRDTVVPVDEV